MEKWGSLFKKLSAVCLWKIRNTGAMRLQLRLIGVRSISHKIGESGTKHSDIW
jgi:hypothetical protein